ncbi:MAG TPA: hypothetical protein VD841_02450 [Arthrobacter sp.]|nr:hypothetical protein [Arthrobacter sp.]
MNGLFFNPLADTTATPAPIRQQASAPGTESSSPAPEAMPRQPRQAPDEKTLRAASLLKVSRDLEHLLRQRGP